MRRWAAIPGIALAVGAGASAPVRTIPLEAHDTKQFAVQATVGGQARRFLFDTGEGLTMISPALAKAVGCEPWGNITAFRMLGERLDLKRCDDVTFGLGGRYIRAPSTIVYDLAEIAGKEAPPLDGAIGLDLFDGQTITLQFGARRVIVEDAASARRRARAGVEVPLRMDRFDGAGIDVFLGVQTPRGLAWMTLDAGNAGPTIFVAPAIAPLLGLKADTKEPQQVEAVLGSGIVFRGKARVFPGMIMDGNLGLQLMRRWDVTLDLKKGRAWLAPATS